MGKNRQSEPSVVINAIERDLMIGSKDRPMEMAFHHVGGEIVVRFVTANDGVQIAIKGPEAAKLRDWLSGLSL